MPGRYNDKPHPPPIPFGGSEPMAFDESYRGFLIGERSG